MEDLGYYLFMEYESMKDKEKEELTEEEKFNLGNNPFFMAEKPTKDY